MTPEGRQGQMSELTEGGLAGPWPAGRERVLGEAGHRRPGLRLSQGVPHRGRVYVSYAGLGDRALAVTSEKPSVSHCALGNPFLCQVLYSCLFLTSWVRTPVIHDDSVGGTVVALVCVPASVQPVGQAGRSAGAGRVEGTREPCSPLALSCPMIL